MASTYIDKSLKGKSIINNIDLTGELTYNETPINTYIKEQLSATSPVIYNSTSGTISLDASNIQPLLTLNPNDLRYNSAGSLALSTRSNLNISFPDYIIGDNVYSIASAIQLNTDGKTYLNYNPKQFNVLAASEITGSEIIRAALNIPVETWDQLQLFSSTLDAVYPLSINPLNNNISLNTTLDFEVVSNQLSIKNQGANCIAFFNNTGQSGIQCNPNLTYISTTLRAPNISTSNLKVTDINCTNSTYQNLLAFDSQIQSLTAGNINVPNITCSSIISNLADINHITSSSLLANNISTS
jgi:hypothetical protein